MELLFKQYELIKGSRQAMLSFMENEAELQLAKPIAEFNNSTINYLLVHITNTYKHWAANFAMYKGLPFADELSVPDLKIIRILFAEADDCLIDFLNHFKEPDTLVTNAVRSGKIITVNVLELFTHMITHEFHHKGQIMTMCRLQGFIPPDTDVIRT